ncbi:MAG: tetratricopeptide repeat protein, partial [Opitutaceae bacterium]|nr:tetratricopeptide repeat protein [Opitutaceae bacterium]
IAKNPNDASTHYLLGSLHESKKDYKAARDAYEGALRANPKMGPALNNLASIYSEHVIDLEKALDAAQRAREALPSQPEVADTLGWIHFKRGQYAQALALLTESAERLPNHAEVRYHAGLASYTSGLEADARRHLEQALKLDPNLSAGADARRCLDVLSSNATGGAAARAVLEKALAARADDPVAQLRLGALHEHEGRPDAALAAYTAALKTNSAFTPAILGTVRVHARKDPAKALAFGREARKTLPAEPHLAAALGRISYQVGEFNAALGLLQEASRRLPDDGELFLDLADAAYAMGAVPAAENALTDGLRAAPNSPRAPKARQFLELIQLAQPGADTAVGAKTAAAALASDPESVPALMLEAIALERGGDLKGALQSYDRILKRYPDFIPAKKRLAIVYAAQPEPPKTAAEVAAKAREAYPGDAEVARAFGLILFRQGNFQRASPLLQDAARTINDDAELLYCLGRAQHELKDTAAAKRSLERALEIGLKGDSAEQARRLLAAATEKK